MYAPLREFLSNNLKHFKALVFLFSLHNTTVRRLVYKYYFLLFSVRHIALAQVSQDLSSHLLGGEASGLPLPGEGLPLQVSLTPIKSRTLAHSPPPQGQTGIAGQKVVTVAFL